MSVKGEAMKDTIFLVDDDSKLRKMVGEYLSGYGYEIVELADGNTVAHEVQKRNPSGVVLDVMMPGKDGFQVLAEIRKISQVPVLMLTAKGEGADRIVGLEMGADDYLPKPFNIRELLARIRAMLRRYSPELVHKGDVLESDGITLDLSSQTLRVEKIEYELTTIEFNVLSTLMRQPNVPVSREMLLDEGWGVGSVVCDRTVDVHISRIRGFLKKHTGHEGRIKTVWGVGYKFVGKKA